MDKLPICNGCLWSIAPDLELGKRVCGVCRRAYEAGRADEKARQIAQVEQIAEILHPDDMMR